MHFNVISLGSECSSANALRELNLRKFALPFDWCVSTIEGIERCFREDFVNFHRNLKLNQTGTRVIDTYGNEFPHDYPTDKDNNFSDFTGESRILPDWEEYIQKNLDKYQRRIERFKSVVEDNTPLIVFYTGSNSNANRLRSLFEDIYGKDNVYIVAKNNNPAISDRYIINCNADKNKWNEVSIWNEAYGKMKYSIEVKGINAVLISGFLKAYKHTFPEFVRTVIKPANADVFCVLKKKSSWKCRTNPDFDEHDEEEFIRKHLGSNLKSLVWIDCVEDTEKYTDKGNEYLKNLWLPKYGTDFCESLEHWMKLRNTVDQYQRLKIAAQEMLNYAYVNGKAYKRVLRTRPDVLPINGPKPWYELDVNYRDVFLHSHNPYECRDLLFVTDMLSIYDICNGFPENYPRYMPITNILPHKTILSPECQLLQYMVKERKFIFYHAPFSPNVDKFSFDNEIIEVVLWGDVWNRQYKDKINVLEL